MTSPLPRSYYSDASHFETELALIFGRAWLPAGHVSDLKGSGSYLTTRVGGCDIVLLKDRDANIRAFHNVCRHRAHRLLEGSGELKAAITCPYHAWTYGLDGTLRHAPKSDGVTGFDQASFGLRPVATSTFAGFITVCFADTAGTPLEIPKELEEFLLADHPSLPSMCEVRRRETVLNANWKTVIENYLECYHCDTAHPSFGDFDLATWKNLVGDGWARQGRVSPGRNDADIGHGDIIGLSAWWQWPSTFWARARGADTFSAVFNEPLAPGRTRQTRIVYALGDVEDDDLKSFNDLFDDVFDEDTSIVESVQRGLGSRGYRGGRLIEQPEARAGWSEHAVHHFQDLVRSALPDVNAA